MRSMRGWSSTISEQIISFVSALRHQPIAEYFFSLQFLDHPSVTASSDAAGPSKSGNLPPGEDSSKDPGFKRLQKLYGSGWISLTPRAALEWESEARPTGDSEVAFCFFAKREPAGEPTEVMSPWFRIPERQREFEQLPQVKGITQVR